MTLIIKVADDKFESVRAVLAQTDGVEAVTEPPADGVNDWDDGDDDNGFDLEPMTREERIAGLRESIQSVKDDIAGKVKLGTLQELIDELRAMPR